MTDPAQLIDAYLDGTLTLEQLRQLEEDLANDPRYADAFAVTAMIDVLLSERFERDTITKSMKLSTGDFLGEQDVQVLRWGSDNAMPADDEPELPPIHLDATALTKQKYVSALAYVIKHTFTPKRITILSTAAAVLLGVVLAIVLLAGPDQKDQVVDASGNASDPNEPGRIVPADPPAVNPIVATLTAERDAVWDRRPGEDVFAGQTLELIGGSAEIKTTSGAVALLQGPCVVELGDDGNSLRLQHGKMVGRCLTPESKGFAVDTPIARIVDYGTEFSIEVGADYKTRVQVLHGEVGVSSKNTSGQLTQYTSVSSRQAVEVSSGEPMASVAFEPGRFWPGFREGVIALGDVVLVDFGWEGEAYETVGLNHNNVAGKQSAIFFTVGDQPLELLKNMIRSRDGAPTGVSFSILDITGVDGVGIGFGDVASGPDSPTIGAFGPTVTRDTIFLQNGHRQDPGNPNANPPAQIIPSKATLRFAGLDDSLTYDLTLMGYVPPSVPLRPGNLFAAGGQSASYNPIGGGTATLKALSTDGQGNLDIVWTLLDEQIYAGQLNGLSLVVSGIKPPQTNP